MRALFLLVCLLAALVAPPFSPSRSADNTEPRETPPTVAPFDQVETHRIRIVNAADGAVQVSQDQGKTWQLVGRVTAPATQAVMGYLASGYAPPGTIAATAVHGLRIRAGDLTSAYPKMVSVLPREFTHTPVGFGGHVAGASGIYTNIPAGTAIFRDLSPYVGNPVYLEKGDDALVPLPLNYSPRNNDVLQIVVRRPANPLTQLLFENKAYGKVTASYADGTQKVVTTVIKPVRGVGRFDGTSYTGAGAVNTNHCGVITVSTAPVTHSTLLEGVGAERRGGFQIEPAFHNSQTEEAGAPQVLIVGSPDKKRVPELEGTPPLFDGHIDLAWDPSDPRRSWVAQVQRGGAAWLPMPEAVGERPDALRGVTAIRLVRADVGDDAWRRGQIAADAEAYSLRELKLARAGQIPVARGRLTINAKADGVRTKYVAFYVDGAFKGITNSTPFELDLNTTEMPDGEYVIEARGEDDNSLVLSTTRTKIWVDNAHRVAQR